YPKHLAAVRSGEMVAPVHVRIKPMNWCNHNCWYCAYRSDNVQLGEGIDLRDRIPDDRMFEIIDDIVDMGVEAVTFSGGGEPLLYKALPECIEKLAAGGVSVATLTNGVNLAGNMAEAFAKHGTWVRISMDAWDDDSYQKSRGAKPGEFDKMVSNIANFKALETDCVLGVSFIIGHDNHEHVLDMCKMLKDAGASHVKLSGVGVANDPTENNIYHDEIRDTVTAQISAAEDLVDEEFGVLNHYHDFAERFEKTYETCPYLKYLTVIGADLKVYACQDKAYTDSGLLGSLEGRGFKEFWFSNENKERINHLNPSKSCQHHCITHAKNLTINEFMSIDPAHGKFV
ncbi:MAG: radical SAM protein, partial [Rhodospirillaceae bacterium]|nr:radical SAM protein [Rhodospirillaceae bacterium]